MKRHLWALSIFLATLWFSFQLTHFLSVLCFPKQPEAKAMPATELHPKKEKSHEDHR